MEISIAIALTLGLTEVLKRSLAVEKRYIPLISIVLGVLVCFLMLKGISLDGVFNGIIAGLSACGLYSGTKATVGK